MVIILIKINNLKELEKILNKKIASALQNEVAQTAKETMREVIYEEVYPKYKPKAYDRKMDNGGLTDYENMQITVINDNTIALRNIRSDWEGTTPDLDIITGEFFQSGIPRLDRDVPMVVETGDGYEWDILSGKRPPPRPFHEPTKEELENTGKAKYALYKGLKRQGLNVEPR